MNAVVYKAYGSPTRLQQVIVDKPLPKDHEVLVKMQAASINSWDWDLLTGKPYIYRLLFGIIKPKFQILGSDIAGKVEAVGKKVSYFKSRGRRFWRPFGKWVCDFCRICLC